jgi:mRNA interferase RelE/StbE
MYFISFTKNAKKDLEKLEHFIRIRIIKQIEKMGNEGRVYIKKIKGSKNDYRLRIGDYRVIFTLENKNITIHKIGHRKNIYCD